MSIEVFLNLLEVIGILTLLLITGYICRRVNLIDDTASKRLSSLIIKLGQPMMIVGALISKDFSTDALKTGLLFMTIGFLIHPLMAALAFCTGPLYREQAERKISRFCFIFTNCGFIGFPILDSILGDGLGSFMGAFFVISFHFYIWIWGIMILGRGRDDIRMTVKKALVNFGTIPCLIGIAIYLLKPLFELPDFLSKVFAYLGGLCTPISVLVTGALIATIAPKRLLTNGKVYYAGLFRLIVMPLVICMLMKLCGFDQMHLLFYACICAVPVAANVTMFSELYDTSASYAAHNVGLTSLLSILTLPLVMFLAQKIAELPF